MPAFARAGSRIGRLACSSGRRTIASRCVAAGRFPAMAVVTNREYGVFIAGESAGPAAGGVRERIEPATGEPLARAAMAGDADVDRAVEAARAAVEGDWGRTPGTERARLMHALADAIVANRA